MYVEAYETASSYIILFSIMRFQFCHVCYCSLCAMCYFLLCSRERGAGGRVLPEKLVGGLRPASQNPYSVSDQSYNKYPSSKQCYITVNIICEGFLLIFFSIMMKKWLLLKYISISWLECKNHTLFMTKTAENHTLWGRTYLYSPYKGVPSPRIMLRWPRKNNF